MAGINELSNAPDPYGLPMQLGSNPRQRASPRQSWDDRQQVVQIATSAAEAQLKTAQEQGITLPTEGPGVLGSAFEMLSRPFEAGWNLTEGAGGLIGSALWSLFHDAEDFAPRDFANGGAPDLAKGEAIYQQQRSANMEKSLGAIQRGGLNALDFLTAGPATRLIGRKTGLGENLSVADAARSGLEAIGADATGTSITGRATDGYASTVGISDIAGELVQPALGAIGIDEEKINSDKDAGFLDSLDFYDKPAQSVAMLVLGVGAAIADPLNKIGAGNVQRAKLVRSAAQARPAAARLAISATDGLRNSKSVQGLLSSKLDNLNEISLTNALLKDGLKADEARAIIQGFAKERDLLLETIKGGDPAALRAYYTKAFGEGSEQLKYLDEAEQAASSLGATTITPQASFAAEAATGQRSLFSSGVKRYAEKLHAGNILKGVDETFYGALTRLNQLPGQGARLFHASDAFRRSLQTGARADDALKQARTALARSAPLASTRTLSDVMARYATRVRYPALVSGALGAGAGALTSDDPLQGAIAGGIAGLGFGLHAGKLRGEQLQTWYRKAFLSDAESAAVAEVELGKAAYRYSLNMLGDEQGRYLDALKLQVQEAAKKQDNYPLADLNRRIVAAVETRTKTPKDIKRSPRLRELLSRERPFRDDGLDPLVREAAAKLGAGTDHLLKLEQALGSFVSELDDLLDYAPRVLSDEIREARRRFPEQVDAALRKLYNHFSPGEASVGVTGAATKHRNARGWGLQEVNEYDTLLRKELNEALGGRLTITNIFEPDPVTAQRHAWRAGMKRVENAQMLARVREVMGTPVDELRAESLAQGVVDGMDELVADLRARVKLNRPDSAKAVKETEEGVNEVLAAITKKRGEEGVRELFEKGPDKDNADELLKRAKAPTPQPEAAKAPDPLEGIDPAIRERFGDKLLKRAIRENMSGEQLLEEASQAARIAYVRQALREGGLEAPEGQISFLDVLADPIFRAATPRSVEEMLQAGTSFLPLSDVAAYKRTAAIAAQPEKGIGRVLGQMADWFNKWFGRVPYLSSPMSLANDTIQNQLVYWTLIEGDPRTKAKALARATSLMVQRWANHPEAKHFAGLVGATIGRFKGKLDDAALEELRAMEAARLFDRVKGVGERTQGLREDLAAGGQKVAGKLGSKAGGIAGTALDATFDAREFAENVHKAAAYLLQRERGMPVLDAVADVRKYYFDYSDLTKFERTWARRLVLFYQFQRKMLPTLLRSMVEHPMRIKMLMLISGMDTQTDERFRESWIGRIPGHVVGSDAAGSPQVLSLGGNNFDVFDALTENTTLDGLASSANPALRLGLEVGFDYDFFSGRPLGQPLARLRGADPNDDVRTGRAIDHAPAFVRYLSQSLKDRLGFDPIPDEQGRVDTPTRYKWDPVWTFLTEKVLPLSAWSRTADLALAADQRKSPAASRAGLAGIQLRSVHDARKDKLLQSELRKLKAAVEAEVYKLPGKPLKARYGRIVPNMDSKLGREYQAALDAAEISIREQGLKGDEKADLLNQARQLFLTRYWPEYAARAELYSMCHKALDYIRDPEQVLGKHSKDMELLQQEALQAHQAMNRQRLGISN